MLLVIIKVVANRTKYEESEVAPMTISCTAVVADKRKQKKLIAALNDLGITPEVHAQTVVAEWQGPNKCMLHNMTYLFEPFTEHSIYYSTMS